MAEDDLRRHIELAFAEAAAAQLLLVCLMRQLRTVVPGEVLEKAFDEVSDDLVVASLKFGTADTPTHLPETLRIVESLRKIVFTRKDTPKRGV